MRRMTIADREPEQSNAAHEPTGASAGRPEPGDLLRSALDTAPPAALPGRGHVLGLDGLRGLAALMVFAEHQIWLGARMHLGRFGVELFFVLSGYLIVGILSRRAGAIESGRTASWPEIKRFFLHRSFRIFPAYYVLLGLGAGAALIPGVFVNFDLYPWYLTYTTNVAWGYVFEGWPKGNFGHLWTLAIEEQFYLLAAPLFLLFRPSRHAWICLGLILLALTVALTLHLTGRPWFAVGMDSFVNFGYLAAGGLVAQLLHPAQGRRDVGLLVAAVLGLGISAYCVAARPEGAAEFVVAVSMGGVAVLVIWQIIANQQSRLVRWLEWRPLREMGKISYAFYLYHIFIKLPKTGLAFAGVDLIVVANLIVTLIVAQASWRLVEQPMLRLRDRMIGDTIGNAAGPAPAVAEKTP